MNEALATAYRQAKAVLHRFVDDLPAAAFGHQPVPGANSPAWIIGHLASVLHRTAGRVGADPSPLPAGFAERFATTKQLAGVQADLGDPVDLVWLFDANIDLVIDSVGRLSSEKLNEPATAPFAKNFGDSLMFGALHIALHAGQLSIARRGLGMPPTV